MSDPFTRIQLSTTEIVRQASFNAGVPLRATRRVVTEAAKLMREALASGRPVTLSKLGRIQFAFRERNGRTYVYPKFISSQELQDNMHKLAPGDVYLSGRFKRIYEQRYKNNEHRKQDTNGRVP